MLQFADKTGQVGGVIWDNHANLVTGTIAADDFVRVQGDVGEFNNLSQITAKKITKVDESTIDLGDFLAVSPRPRAEMEAELDDWIARVKNPDCKRLLSVLFGNPRLRELYCTCPAAAKVHQAYIHGLLDHTLNVMKLAYSIANVYEPVDRCTLITGTLLHDIGKVRELDWRRSITYTTEGRLLGHIPMGASMVDATINELRRKESFDQELQTRIIHMILSHHGKLEYGSPITPKTREALTLHYADNTEAYMAVFTTEVDKATTRGQAWTPFTKMFDSYLYAGKPAPLPEGAILPPTAPAETNHGGPVDDVRPPR